MRHNRPHPSLRAEPYGLTQGLLIPYALAGAGVPQRRLRPSEAEKGPRYVCPECAQSLRLHGGGRQRLHFRHDAYVQPCGFREDGADRVIARHAVLDAAGRPEGVRLIRRCPVCGSACEQAWPRPVAEARLKTPVEVVAGAAPRLADVALLDAAAQTVAVIEIHRDREPPGWRFRDLATLPWVVAAAKPIIADPHHIRAEHAGHFPAPACAVCAATARPAPALEWARARLPAAVLAESAAAEAAFIVDVDTGELLKRLHAPLAAVHGHCAFLNQRAGRRRYVVVHHGEVVA